jgi:hypothetical protein
MEFLSRKKLVRNVSLAMVGGSLLCGSSMVLAKKPASYELSGPCAFLPAERATEFHGNPDRAKLRLAMAGNQWVVFQEALQAFNVYIGKGDGSEPGYRPNPGWTLADLNLEANRIYTQLIPPGQLVKQITSGCMTLGNDEERNLLPGNIQTEFDVFASTNYSLMRKLAAKGFVSRAVPYIKNRLDLMVVKDNPKSIGADSYAGTVDANFDAQFDIVMDLLSGDVVTSKLDHINEGIHKASNKYMGAAHDYIRARDNGALISMTYTLADGTSLTASMTASDWVQAALKNVAAPQAGSPGARRLQDSGDALAGDAGETHSGNGHNLVARGCTYSSTEYEGRSDPYLSGPTYKFCEFATLNKATTHESRVHHVETPNGLVGAPANGYVPVDVGFVWITEVAYQLNHGNDNIEGMSGTDISNLGIPRPADGPAVNANNTYSLALLATSRNEKRGQQFIDFLRSPEGQMVYTNGGFTGLNEEELAAGEVYDCNGDGVADSVGVLNSGEADPQSC